MPATSRIRRRNTHKVQYIYIYLEYHSVSPLVRIVTSPTLSPVSECVSPPGPKGHTRLRVRGYRGVPIRTSGEKA